MKKEYVHVFLSHTLITAVHVKNDHLEVLFSDVNLQSLDKILNTLIAYHQLPFRIVLDSYTLQIKTINTERLHYWHRHQVQRRLKEESTHYDYHTMWREGSNLIFIQGTLSTLAKEFMQALMMKNFLVQSATPCLWVLNKTLLQGHQISRNGIVQIILKDHIQHILYLNGVPTLVRTSNNTDTRDWQQFIHTKHTLTLETLDLNQLISAIGKPTDFFPLYVLRQTYPSVVVFSKSLNLYRYHKIINVVKQIFHGGIAASFIGVSSLLYDIPMLNTTHSTLASITTTQQNLLDKLPVNAQLESSSSTYLKQRGMVEIFNAQSFPVMSFLERVSKILPHYGQVIHLKIIPQIDGLKASKHTMFSVHVMLVPLKSSKNLQLLNTELRKTFGTDLLVNVVKNNTTASTEDLHLKNSVQINMTGSIDGLSRLLP